jgi:hypothetical protein
MAQLHFYISDQLALKLHEKANALGVTTSRYIAELVKREIEDGWPPNYFEKVVGQWQGDFEREQIMEFEEREEF